MRPSSGAGLGGWDFLAILPQGGVEVMAAHHLVLEVSGFQDS